MSTPKRSSKSPKKKVNTKRVAKKAANVAVKRVERKLERPKAARTRAGLAGYGFQASFDHQWALPVPASIGNVTESSRKHVTVTYERTELVTGIQGNTSATAVVDSYYINPRRSTIFPWVSGQALGYETYRFKKLRFRYQPKCGTDEKGTVTIGIDYDVSDAAVASEQALMTIPGSKQANPYIGFTIDALSGGRSDFAKFLFLSDNATSDVTKNLGRLFILVSGTTSANSVFVGELYVDYVLELSIAQADTAGVLRGRAVGLTQTTASGITVANALGATTVVMGSSSDFATCFQNSSAPLLIFYPGRYFVVIYFATNGTISYGTGGCTFTAVSGGSCTYLKEHGTGASTTLTEFGTLDVFGLDVQITLALSPLVASFTGAAPNSHLLILPCSLDFDPVLSAEAMLRKDLAIAENRLSRLEARLVRTNSSELKKRAIVDDEQCSFIED
jgi:hypothetical protein